MIKTVLFIFLILQVISLDRKVKLRYNDELVLKNLTSGNDISISLKSLPDNDATIPITVQLREIQDLNNPLNSVQLSSQSCAFTDSVCTVTFTAPTINSAYKYVVRLAESTTIHNVEIKVIKNITQQKKQGGQGKVQLTPLGATNPGFRFYVAAAGTWTVSFAVVSSPAPTISSFDFNLWSLSGGQLSSPLAQSSSTSGSLTFTIVSAGSYYLSTGLTVSSMNTSTKYPIQLQYKFVDDVCPSGSYLDRNTSLCVACSTVANSLGTTTVSGKCDCTTNYFWTRENTCNACPTSGCPTTPVDGQRPDQNRNNSNPPSQPPTSNGGSTNLRQQGQGRQNGRK